MQYGKAHTKFFVSLEKMAQIGARVALATRAITFGRNGTVIIRILFVDDVDLALPGKEVAVTRSEEHTSELQSP